MTARRLGELQKIVAAQLEAELATLRERTAGAEESRARVAALDTAVARQQDEIAEVLEAHVAGAVFDRWGAWAERRRVALTADHARDLALAEVQRQTALKAFGRAEALRQVADEAGSAAARLRQRRARRSDV
jgi:hypothetical protein